MHYVLSILAMPLCSSMIILYIATVLPYYSYCQFLLLHFNDISNHNFFIAFQGCFKLVLVFTTTAVDMRIHAGKACMCYHNVVCGHVPIGC